MISERHNEGCRTGHERGTDTTLPLLSSSRRDVRALNSGGKIVAMMQAAEPWRKDGSRRCFRNFWRDFIGCIRNRIGQSLTGVDGSTGFNKVP